MYIKISPPPSIDQATLNTHLLSAIVELILMDSARQMGFTGDLIYLGNLHPEDLQEILDDAQRRLNNLFPDYKIDIE